jgi:hypothetical protein
MIDVPFAAVSGDARQRLPLISQNVGRTFSSEVRRGEAMAEWLPVFI